MVTVDTRSSQRMLSYEVHEHIRCEMQDLSVVLKVARAMLWLKFWTKSWIGTSLV